jgi:hypothetical protein
VIVDERVAATELAYLAAALEPPADIGGYTLTGQLARSATAVLYTARGQIFGTDEGVLKVTGTAYAPILERELRLLAQAASVELDGLVRPASAQLVWLAVGGSAADRPAAALALPFLSGGDLTAVAARASRTGSLGVALALQVARPVATALRGLLRVLERPVVHGDVRPQNVVLPSPTATFAEVLLIDLDAARELEPAIADRLERPPREVAAALVEDVHGFGEILCLLTTGRGDQPPTSDVAPRAFEQFVRRCLGRDGEQYRSMADEQLWHDLAAAEREHDRPAWHWYEGLLDRLR